MLLFLSSACVGILCCKPFVYSIPDQMLTRYCTGTIYKPQVQMQMGLLLINSTQASGLEPQRWQKEAGAGEF